jgi:hypothetical protein
MFAFLESSIGLFFDVLPADMNELVAFDSFVLKLFLAVKHFFKFIIASLKL